MKKLPLLILAFSIIAISSIDVPVNVNNSESAVKSSPSLAILDTAVNADLPIFKNRIIHEVCILEWDTCNNNKSFMDGPGSASMPLDQMSNNGFDHGTKMAHAAIVANPNIDIVFIRIVGATKDGMRQGTGQKTIVKALDWIVQNKNKFNIQAVSMSQSNYDLNDGKNYCPDLPQIKSSVLKLLSLDIPVFFPSGNDMDYKRVAFPGCIKEAITVSATASTGSNMPATYSNYDKRITDFFAPGALKVYSPNGYLSYEFGTSISTQIAASVYIGIKSHFKEYDSSAVLSLMLQNSKQLTGTKSDARIVDYKTLENAINGL